MNKNKQRKFKFQRQTALFLTGALLAGLLPLGTVTKSRAAEQPALRNPRILKTTQEVAPGSAGKKELKNPTTENGITTWDCIWFGNYWQEDTNGDGKADKNDEKTPIKWRVLSVEGDDVFLLADKNLDCQKYNDTFTDVTWETCTMRSWLNGYGAEANREGKSYRENGFLNHAFTVDEQSAIRKTNVVNRYENKYGTKGGNDTSDQIYLLSIGEAKNPAYGFTSNEDDTKTREAENTVYADGRKIQSSGLNDADSTHEWLLRSPGYHSNNASYVYDDGGIDGNHFVYNDVAVRPVLHLDLSLDLNWSYAGTIVISDMLEGMWKKYSGFVDGVERTLTLKWLNIVDEDDLVLGLSLEILLRIGDGSSFSVSNSEDYIDVGIDRYGTVQILEKDKYVFWWSYDLEPDYSSITFRTVPNSDDSKGYMHDIESFIFEGEGEQAVIVGYKSTSGDIYPIPSFDEMKAYAEVDSPIQPSYVTGNQPTESATPMPSVSSLPTSVPATLKPTNTPDIAPTHSPGTAPTIHPSQTMIPPSATAVPVPDGIGAWDNSNVTGLKKGDCFVAGNIKYRVAKLKGKKGEVAVVGVKSKKSKSLAIPQKVKKEGIAFTVTSIQKNAFMGCKKANKLTIKSTSIRGIAKKAFTGLSKKIQIKIPKSKVPQYWSALRKLGYSKIDW